MNFYSYKMTYDYGFAPNPFGGVCSLATCKPNIRKRALIGDWVLGTGSKEIGMANRVIYLMKITEKLLLEDYWIDKRFNFKKPLENGGLVRIHGDNVYSRDEENNWCQSFCQHSHPLEKIRKKHIARDTSGKYVLLSTEFYYFGKSCFEIDTRFKSVCSQVRNYKSSKSIVDMAIFEDFTDWVKGRYEIGVHGDPVHWREYDQGELFL